MIWNHLVAFVKTHQALIGIYLIIIWDSKGDLSSISYFEKGPVKLIKRVKIAHSF